MFVYLSYIPRTYYYMDPTYILVIFGALICMIASANVNRTFNKYSRFHSKRGVTGAQVAEMILRNAGISGVQIEHTGGNLTDHYDPRANVVRLSDSVYNASSIAAVGVAAHECGHVIQHHTGYVPIQVRSAIVPIVNFGSKLSWPIIIIGLIIGHTPLIYAGIILFALVLLFQIVTLPVEFNASGRALAILRESNMLYEDELKGARKVLTAAGMTYVTATISTLLQLLRLILLFARRDD
ncbi:MAG: zinc metallopeptidase [Lachnospiraceae bacterium]|nr:zinc metallopeptidase [Lachnospiraceae bacterium]